MQCQNCDRPIHPSDERCQNCGAKPLHRRVVLGASRREFTLTPEEPLELDESSSSDDWQFPERPARSAQEPTRPTERAATETVRWGGFMRRAGAMLVDGVVVFLLIVVMCLMSFVSYKVGLSAHGRSVNWSTLAPLFFFLAWGAMVLATGYFTIFHGMDGKTIGKRLLGLRVVGPDLTKVTYRQALLRWVAMVGFAPTVLSLLWILWSREKRAWHDYAARTWVVRN